MGVGPVPEKMDPKDFVLRAQPADRLHELADRAADALSANLTEGFDAAMNHVNGIGV